MVALDRWGVRSTAVVASRRHRDPAGRVHERPSERCRREVKDGTASTSSSLRAASCSTACCIATRLGRGSTRAHAAAGHGRRALIAGEGSGCWRHRPRQWACIEVRARWVVGADGLGSPASPAPWGALVARCGPAREPRSTRTTPATGRPSSTTSAKRPSPASSPPHDGQACIWICRPSRWSRASRRQRREPAEAFDRPHGQPAVPEPRRPARPGRPEVARARDASHADHFRQAAGSRHGHSSASAGYHRDAVTGHGISDAFRDAELLRGRSMPRSARTADCGKPALTTYGHERDRTGENRDVFDGRRARLSCHLPPPGPLPPAARSQLALAIDVMAGEHGDPRLLPRAPGAQPRRSSSSTPTTSECAAAGPRPITTSHPKQGSTA